MFFNQYYLECLSHASYLIGDTTSGKAVVIGDPRARSRDPDEHFTVARGRHGAFRRLQYVGPAGFANLDRRHRCGVQRRHHRRQVPK